MFFPGGAGERPAKPEISGGDFTAGCRLATEKIVGKRGIYGNGSNEVEGTRGLNEINRVFFGPETGRRVLRRRGGGVNGEGEERKS